jgi:hypothetical protein
MNDQTCAFGWPRREERLRTLARLQEILADEMRRVVRTIDASSGGAADGTSMAQDVGRSGR